MADLYSSLTQIEDAKLIAAIKGGATRLYEPPKGKTLEQMVGGKPNRAQRRAKKSNKQGRSRRITAVSRTNPRAHELS